MFLSKVDTTRFSSVCSYSFNLFMLQGGNTSDKTLHKRKEDADDPPSQFHPKMNQEENKAFHVQCL